MFTPMRLRLWALVLLATPLGWSGSAFAQSPKAKPNANQKDQKPINQLSNRQAAREELAAAVAQRAQNDPQFKRYVEAVAEHNKRVKEFVESKKGGAK
jgi:hypothetical protein